MKSIFDICAPRNEGLRGELQEQQFTTLPTKMLRGNADAVHGDTATLIVKTYATRGTEIPIRECVGCLIGNNPGVAAVFRIETKFISSMVGLATRMRGGDGWPIEQTRT